MPFYRDERARRRNRVANSRHARKRRAVEIARAAKDTALPAAVLWRRRMIVDLHGGRASRAEQGNNDACLATAVRETGDGSPDRGKALQNDE